MASTIASSVSSFAEFCLPKISLDGKAISPGDSAKTHPGPKLSKAKGQRKAAEGGKGQSRKEKKKKKRAGQQGEGKQSKSKTKKNAKKDKA